MDRQTKYAVTIFCVVIVFIMALAAYGYFTGAWDSAPSSP